MKKFSVDRRKARMPHESDVLVVIDKSGPLDWSEYFFEVEAENEAHLVTVDNDKPTTDRTEVAEYLLRRRHEIDVVYGEYGNVLCELHVGGSD